MCVWCVGEKVMTENFSPSVCAGGPDRGLYGLKWCVFGN